MREVTLQYLLRSITVYIKIDHLFVQNISNNNTSNFVVPKASALIYTRQKMVLPDVLNDSICQ